MASLKGNKLEQFTDDKSPRNFPALTGGLLELWLVEEDSNGSARVSSWYGLLKRFQMVEFELEGVFFKKEQLSEDKSLRNTSLC